MSYQVESGIPLPGPRKYPWHAMNVGDSFLVPAHEGAAIRSAASYMSRRNAPKRWITKTLNTGVRVWRAA